MHNLNRFTDRKLQKFNDPLRALFYEKYRWPLLITTDKSMYTIVMCIKQMLEAAEESPEWHLIMMTTLMAMIPPVVVVIAMQRLFVKGLVETEK